MEDTEYTGPLTRMVLWMEDAEYMGVHMILEIEKFPTCLLQSRDPPQPVTWFTCKG